MRDTLGRFLPVFGIRESVFVHLEILLNTHLFSRFRNITVEKSDSQVTNQSSLTDSSSSPKLRGIRSKLNKTSDKKQNSPKLKRMNEIDRGPKVVRPEKFRGVPDGERKVHIDESANNEKVHIIEIDRQAKPKAKPPNIKMENAQMYQESPSKIAQPNSTGIPKPMAAVKGTTKVSSSTDLTALKSRSPSISKIPNEVEKQKRDDVCVALVSPMRTSAKEDGNKTSDDDKRGFSDVDKKLKDVEEEEMMSVKPMSPLLNGYRLASHSSLHFTHPGYITNPQTSKNVYYSQVKANPNMINLESIDLAIGRFI